MEETAVDYLHSEYKRIFGNVFVDVQKVFEISDSLAKAKEIENRQKGYSEEEVHKIIGSYSAHKNAFSIKFTYDKWFKQFKK